MGAIKIAEPVYMMMTFRSIMNAIKGYNRDQEQQFQADWERARFIAAWATMKKMKDITFPWETEGEQSSLDRLKAIRAREQSIYVDNG